MDQQTNNLTHITDLTTTTGVKADATRFFSVDINNDPLAAYALMAYAVAVEGTNAEFSAELVALALRPVPVERDEMGSFFHPACPPLTCEFVEPEGEEGLDAMGDPDAAILDEDLDVKQWCEDNGLQVALIRMSDDDDSDKLEKLFDETASYASWEPTPPRGPDWFVLAIYDSSEDGVVAVYVRKLAKA